MKSGENKNQGIEFCDMKCLKGVEVSKFLTYLECYINEWLILIIKHFIYNAYVCSYKNLGKRAVNCLNTLKILWNWFGLIGKPQYVYGAEILLDVISCLIACNNHWANFGMLPVNYAMMTSCHFCLTDLHTLFFLFGCWLKFSFG